MVPAAFSKTDWRLEVNTIDVAELRHNVMSGHIVIEVPQVESVAILKFDKNLVANTFTRTVCT